MSWQILAFLGTVHFYREELLTASIFNSTNKRFISKLYLFFYYYFLLLKITFIWGFPQLSLQGQNYTCSVKHVHTALSHISLWTNTCGSHQLALFAGTNPTNHIFSVGLGLGLVLRSMLTCFIHFTKNFQKV